MAQPRAQVDLIAIAHGQYEDVTVYYGDGNFYLYNTSDPPTASNSLVGTAKLIPLTMTHSDGIVKSIADIDINMREVVDRTLALTDVQSRQFYYLEHFAVNDTKYGNVLLATVANWVVNHNGINIFMHQSENVIVNEWFATRGFHPDTDKIVKAWASSVVYFVSAEYTLRQPPGLSESGDPSPNFKLVMAPAFPTDKFISPVGSNCYKLITAIVMAIGVTNQADSTITVLINKLLRSHDNVAGAIAEILSGIESIDTTLETQITLYGSDSEFDSVDDEQMRLVLRCLVLTYRQLQQRKKKYYYNSSMYEHMTWRTINFINDMLIPLLTIPYPRPTQRNNNMIICTNETGNGHVEFYIYDTDIPDYIYMERERQYGCLGNLDMTSTYTDGRKYENMGPFVDILGRTTLQPEQVGYYIDMLQVWKSGQSYGGMLLAAAAHYCLSHNKMYLFLTRGGDAYLEQYYLKRGFINVHDADSGVEAMYGSARDIYAATITPSLINI